MQNCKTSLRAVGADTNERVLEGGVTTDKLGRRIVTEKGKNIYIKKKG